MSWSRYSLLAWSGSVCCGFVGDGGDAAGERVSELESAITRGFKPALEDTGEDLPRNVKRTCKRKIGAGIRDGRKGDLG